MEELSQRSSTKANHGSFAEATFPNNILMAVKKSFGALFPPPLTRWMSSAGQAIYHP